MDVHSVFPVHKNDDRFLELFNRAVAAGRAEALKTVPTPMTVVGASRYYYEAEGACGFAWVNVKPGNLPFANWLKATGRAASDSYAGGVTIWISDYNQSVDRKEAHAYAMADLLRAAGHHAYAGSRLD